MKGGEAVKKSERKSKMFSHISIMAIALIMAVTVTFSWLPRSSQKSLGTGNMLQYSQSGNINGSGGEVHTYAGTSDNGVITYAATELAESDSITAEPGGTRYFKTVIKDSSDGNKTNVVSVYLENLKYSTDMGDSLKIGLTDPEKTYVSYLATASGSYNVIDSLCLEDNIIIEAKGEKTIYWFIALDSDYSGNGSIILDKMHLVYN